MSVDTGPDSAGRTRAVPTKVMPALARRHDIDRLRILAVLLLLPFHSARVFNADDWYVKNTPPSPFLGRTIVEFLDPWHMPLLFVLAGVATWFALGHRSAGTYARERTRRLLVPFVFGLVVIVPPQTWFGASSHGPHVSIGTMYADFWRFEGDLSGYTGGFTPGHMWFVAYLFVFSLVALPLLVRLREAATPHDLGRPWFLFALPLVLLVTEALPGPENAWNPFTCLGLFVAGFVYASSPTLQRIVERRWPWILAGAVLTMTAVYAVNIADPAWADRSWQDALFQVLENTNTWMWVLGLIGAARAFLDRPDTPALRYANQAAYPWYILHQTVIVAVAYVVVGWDLGIAVKFVAVLVFSTAVTLLVYDLLVRRWDPVRFLFGLKRKPERARGPAPLR